MDDSSIAPELRNDTHYAFVALFRHDVQRRLLTGLPSCITVTF